VLASRWPAAALLCAVWACCRGFALQSKQPLLPRPPTGSDAKHSAFLSRFGDAEQLGPGDTAADGAQLASSSGRAEMHVTPWLLKAGLTPQQAATQDENWCGVLQVSLGRPWCWRLTDCTLAGWLWACCALCRLRAAAFHCFTARPQRMRWHVMLPASPLSSASPQEVCLDTGGHPAAFMAAATDFCNDQCWGTLSCAVFAHPATQVGVAWLAVAQLLEMVRPRSRA